LMTGSVKVIPLVKGPVRRQLSIVLLNGPEPKGPVGQLLKLLRENSPGVSGSDDSGQRETTTTSAQGVKALKLRKAVP
jgi:hypothetical protein